MQNYTTLRKKALEISLKILLSILSVLLCLSIVELSLRQFRSDIKYAAESLSQYNRHRIHSTKKNSSKNYPHPDSEIKHIVRHNSLGLRQHRDFAFTKPSNATRIGFFGDSFTENVRIPVQYSFTEPLDYLLNKTGSFFEVLNFGNDGYGTDQVYLQYMDEGINMDLDIVIYLYCENDLRDILANQLIELDLSKKHIKYIPAERQSWWVSFIKRFYLTYWALDVFKRLELIGDDFIKNKWDLKKIKAAQNQQNKRRMEFGTLGDQLADGIETQDLKKALSIFSALINKIKVDAESRSSKFYVALFPGFKNQTKGSHNRKIKKILEGLSVETLDLFPIFRNQERQTVKDFYFINDGHWNEEGNKLAAVYIFKFLLEKLKLASHSESDIKKELYEYYSAFPPVNVTNSWLIKTPIPTARKQKIAQKYLELEPFPPDFYDKFYISTNKPAEYFFLQANSYYSRGDYINAIKSYSKGISLESKNLMAYNNRGMSYANVQKFELAILDLKKVCSGGIDEGCQNLDYVINLIKKQKR